MVIVIFLLILFIMFNSSAVSDTPITYSTPLVTRIVSIDSNTPDQQSDVNEFRFLVVAEVWNQYEVPISIDHPDTCGFKINISALDTKPPQTLYTDIACGAAITNEIFDPGVTQVGMSVIFVLSDLSSKIPDGEYALTYGSPSIGMYNELVSFIQTTLIVSNGIIIFENGSIPNEWGTTISGPITISSNTSYENNQTSNYIVTTDEKGVTSTIFVSRTSVNTDGSIENTKNDNEGVPDAVSETLNFNFGLFLVGLFLFSMLRILKRLKV